MACHFLSEGADSSKKINDHITELVSNSLFSLLGRYQRAIRRQKAALR